MLPDNQCSGCMVCSTVCPKQCIDIKKNQEGFIYPIIQTERCIHCLKCEKSCPVLNHIEKKQPFCEDAYAAYTTDKLLRFESSSGGIFSAIASWVLKNKGVVYGAALSEKQVVEHILVNSEEELYRLRGSKYVQSSLVKCYIDIKKQLNTGKIVLFTGTPCQVEGILAFLGKHYDNLITADIICHGVPSPKVWETYLEWQQEKKHQKIVKSNFRDKTSGWKKFSMKLVFENNDVYCCDLQHDPYMQAFLENISLRKSCYQCAFKGKYRASDFTLADLWGIHNIIPELDDDKGTSLVFIHSDKGQQILDAINNTIRCVKIDEELAIAHNGAMIHSVYEHPLRGYFFYQLGKQSFDNLVHDCINPNYRVRLKRKILKIMKIIQ